MVSTDRIKADVDFLALVSQDVDLRKVATTGGGEWAGACPFCGGRDRFRVWPLADHPHWWCRGCERKGDAVDYVRERGTLQGQRLTYSEACALLGTTPRERPQVGAKAAGMAVALPEEPPPSAWQEAAKRVAEAAMQTLWSPIGAKALAYLRERRAFTDKTIHTWRLGYNAAWRKYNPTLWGSDDAAPVWLPAGIVIPGWAAGSLWYLKVRVALPGDSLAAYIGGGQRPGPKYVQVRGSRPALFGADSLPGHAVAVLCEGEFDALLLWQQAGELVSTVTLGSATAKLEGRWLWALSAANRVIVAYDNDLAGRTASEQLANVSGRVRQVKPLGAKDLTDMYLAGGDLRSWVLAILQRYGGAPAEPVEDSHLPGKAELEVQPPAVTCFPSRPSMPCPACKCDEWWERPTGGWVCGRCHPDPERLYAGWLAVQVASVKGAATASHFSE